MQFTCMTNKQTKIEGVAAPRQLGQNDQTHRGQTPFPYSTEKETPQEWQKDQHKVSSYTLYQEFKPLGIKPLACSFYDRMRRRREMVERPVWSSSTFFN